MKLYDFVYDTDANIEGLIIKKGEDYDTVLWDNNVLGLIKEDDPALKLTGIKRNIHKYVIVDIFHTGNTGPKGEPKTGEDYEIRKDKIVYLDMKSLPLSINEHLIWNLYDPKDLRGVKAARQIDCQKLTTTRLKEVYNDRGCLFIKTKNSLYKLREVR